MQGSAALIEYLFFLGDNALILAHRLSEWLGHSPIVEEELAVANVSLDLLGEARAWLTLAGDIEGAGRDEDALAYRRDACEFRNLLLVEQPNGDFGDTIARQFLFDTWHRLLLDGLAASSEPRIAEIAAGALNEATYHQRRSGDWVVTLGDGTGESHRRMQRAIDDVWMYAGEMFEMRTGDAALVEARVIVDHATLREPWNEHVDDVLAAATLDKPQLEFTQTGGRRGVHSEHLGYLLAEMQFLQRRYPNATW